MPGNVPFAPNAIGWKPWTHPEDGLAETGFELSFDLYDVSGRVMNATDLGIGSGRNGRFRVDHLALSWVSC